MGQPDRPGRSKGQGGVSAGRWGGELMRCFRRHVTWSGAGRAAVLLGLAMAASAAARGDEGAEPGPDPGTGSGAAAAREEGAGEAAGVASQTSPSAESPAGDSPDGASAAAAAPAATRAERCRVKLDVTGELIAPAGRGQPSIRRPIEMAARFDFEERPLPEAATAARIYTDAVATMRVGDAPLTTSLATDARRVLVARQGATVEPHLAEGCLTGAEHDLLSTPFDAMLLDDMLPSVAVADGATWDISPDLTAGLLAIDTVESGRIEARLEEVAGGRGRVSFSGAVDGGVDGVPTHVDVSGSFFAEARVVPETAGDTVAAADGPVALRHEFRRPVDQLSVVIRERRQAGHVAPGFDVEARMLVARAATDGERRGPSPPATVGSRPRRPGAGGPGRVWYRDADGRFDLVHDARWRVVEEGGAGLVMRLVDRGALVGQCSIAATRGDGVDSPTTDDVRRDIERSLSGQVATVGDGGAEERDDGVRVIRVVSSGTAERLPFTWIHYVLATPRGGRVDVTFMVQDSMLPRFAEADRDLVASLAPSPPAAAPEPAGPAAVQEARAPSPPAAAAAR